MVHADLPYTYCSRKRLKHGVREYWRFRRDGTDCPLPGNPATDTAAMRRYAELIDQADAIAKATAEPDRHTFAWLARQYCASAEYGQLAESTQLDYAKVLDRLLIPALGPERFDCINRAAIKVVRDAVLAEGKSARTANKVKQVASLLYSWADDEELLPAGFANPGRALRKLKGRATPIEIWSAEEIALFLSQCDAPMKTAVLLALYTGQRAADVVAMEWSDHLGNTIRVRQGKTDEPLVIPCHPVLARHLKAIRTRFAGPILRMANGKPTNANALAGAMYRAIGRIDGMPRRSMHGLRYAAAGNLAQAGCTVSQISAIIGHRTYQMAMKYAAQRADAEAAIARLGSQA